MISLSGVVLVLALAGAAVEVEVPAAHDGGGVALGAGEEFVAASVAGIAGSVPHAVVVVVAGVLGAVLERALHGALVLGGVPAAHGVRFAASGGGLRGAIGSAEVLDGVPDTLSISVALVLVGPTVGALLATVAIDPHAGGADVAAGDSEELVAVAVADVGAVVPLTLGVGVAGRLGVVVRAALDHALVLVVELAHGVGLATSGAAARSSAVLEVAGLAAGAFARSVPHAAVVGGAGSTGVVEELAALGAGSSGGVPQARVVGDAPVLGGESCAATEASAAGAPFAVVITKAHGFGGEICAALAAGVVAEVPHAIGITVAGSVVGVSAERAAHVARPLDVELPAAVVHGGASGLLLKIAASVVAGGDGGVPHTLGVGNTFALAVVFDVALLVAAVHRGAEALPFAEFVGLTLGLGDSLVPLAFVGVAGLDALGAVLVPLAVGVGIATDVLGLADVGVVAAHAAGGFGLIPFAVNIVPAFTFVNDLGALLGALAAVLVPDAPVVVVTRGGVGVAVEAAALAEVGVVGLSGAHVLAVAVGVDLRLLSDGVLLRVEAGAGHHANLLLGVVHAVEVGVAGGGSGLGVGVTTLHAAENFELSVDHGLGDHGLELAAVVGIRCAEGVVVRVASAEALVDVVVELAHGVGVALVLLGNHSAATLALVEGRIPHAFVVAIAVVLVGPAPLAVLGADGGTSAPDAHALSFAGSD